MTVAENRREAGTVFSIFIAASLCVLRHLASNIRDDGERAFRRLTPERVNAVLAEPALSFLRWSR